jgi:hypothetical protein
MQWAPAQSKCPQRLWLEAGLAAVLDSTSALKHYLAGAAIGAQVPGAPVLQVCSKGFPTLLSSSSSSSSSRTRWQVAHVLRLNASFKIEVAGLRWRCYTWPCKPGWAQQLLAWPPFRLGSHVCTARLASATATMRTQHPLLPYDCNSVLTVAAS